MRIIYFSVLLTLQFLYAGNALDTVKFTHEKHENASGAECDACHGDGEPGPENAPSMAKCLSCHNDKKAPSSCRACHSDLTSLKPATHNTRWLYRDGHGLEAKFGVAPCSQCHRDSECDACHTGNRAGRIHDPNYRYTHGLDAKTRDKDCALCHETVNQCRSCH